MWTLYDELIDEIPEDLVIEDFIIGCAWTMVKASGNVGVALTVKGRVQEPIYSGNVIGDSVKSVARCIKSWNFTEASLGMAAINCFYNIPHKVAALGGFDGLENINEDFENNTKKDAFSMLAKEAAGKNIAVIGRFPHLERQLSSICRLSILERDPDLGDFPDTACEYILPEQDMVFITGMTLTNKTLPRLLQITKSKSRIIMVGPSVPLTPTLYHYGVTDLNGFCVTNAEKTTSLVKRGDNTSIFKGGTMVSISRWINNP